MNTLADRILWEQTGNGIRVLIPGRRNWASLFIAVWLIAWTFAGKNVRGQILAKWQAGTVDWFSWLWMVGWGFW